MLRMHVVQAEEGDCFILEYGLSEAPQFALIDGGPAGIYEEHLRKQLLAIRDRGGTLDLVVLSHVDDDHVRGLLDLMEDLRARRQANEPATIDIDGLWHNSFGRMLGPDTELRFRTLMDDIAFVRGAAMPASDVRARSIRQGDELSRHAAELGLGVNAGLSPMGLICIDDVPQPIPLADLKVRVLGPSRPNLARLKEKWRKWLQQQEKRIFVRDPFEAERAAVEADASVPNLSSIMLLVEAGEKTLLLTGDGLADDIMAGLANIGCVGPGGRFHANVLKMPHHGSARNVSPEFLRAVTADTYVISANGKHDNPDLDTLIWMVEAAREQGRAIEIFSTNATDSTQQLVEQYDPDEYGYRLVEMKPGDHSAAIEIAA